MKLATLALVGLMACVAAPSYAISPAARDEQLKILRDERDDIQKSIVKAVVAQPTAVNQTEAKELVSRLHLDLAAINREISRAEGQHATAEPTAFRKPAASAANELSLAQTKVEASNAETTYEAWDVFKNFGMKR